MPTKKKRLTITLDDYSAEILAALSTGSHVSQAAVINELFRLIGPSLVQLTAVKQALNAGLVNSGHDAMQGFLDGLQKDVVGMISQTKKEYSEDCKK